MPDSGVEGRKNRFWQVDPTIFQAHTETRIVDRLAHFGGMLGRLSLFGLLFLYPVFLLLIGLFFGGIAFWGSFLGTVALVGTVIWKGGYARNFENWNPSHSKQLIGMTVGFLATLGFIIGLATLHLWFLPVFVGVLMTGIIFALKKSVN